MVTFVIFWAAIFAIIFFVLGIFFKTLASAFNAFLASAGGVLAIGILATLAGVILYLLYLIIGGIITEGFLSVVMTIVMLLVAICIYGAILGGLGATLLEMFVSVAVFILEIISSVFEWFATVCKKAYEKFLTVIISRLDKY